MTARSVASWALAAACVVAYVPSLAGVFQFDDYNVIVDYGPVHSWRALFEHGGSVRLLLKASYALNWTLGNREIGFHVLNIALHAANAVLLLFIGQELARRWVPEEQPWLGAAFAAALLFALHPAQTEAVSYISGRSVSLMSLFYLGAILVYLRRGSRALSCALFALAMAARETAVTLPAALLLCELCDPRRAHWRELVRRQGVHWALLFAAALALLLDSRYFALLQTGFTRRGVAENLLTQAGGISYLVWRLVSLSGYNVDPALPVLSSWDARLAFEAALLGGLLALALASLRKRPWLAFGILWFFLQLAPTNSFVPRFDVANDRQLYLASWGLFLALALQVAQAGLPSWLSRAAALVLISLFAAASVSRQLDYASEIALWQAAVREAPWNARAHNNLGYAYQLSGRKDDASREYRLALALDPQNGKARFNAMLLETRR